MRAIFMVGYVGLPCPIVLPVPRLSCKTLFRLALEGYRLGRCRTMRPYGSRRGGSKYVPSRTLCLAACITPHMSLTLFSYHNHLHPQLCLWIRAEKGRAVPRGRVGSSSSQAGFPPPPVFHVLRLTDSTQVSLSYFLGYGPAEPDWVHTPEHRRSALWHRGSDQRVFR